MKKSQKPVGKLLRADGTEATITAAGQEFGMRDLQQAVKGCYEYICLGKNPAALT